MEKSQIDKRRIVKITAEAIKSLAIKAKNLPWFLGRHAFLATLVFLLIDFTLGAAIYYKYVFLPKNQEPQTPLGIVIFNEKKYNEVLKFWEERDKALKTDFSGLANPFD